jgi:hypothetical protein
LNITPLPPSLSVSETVPEAKALPELVAVAWKAA